jgi:hypothetical protein
MKKDVRLIDRFFSSAIMALGVLVAIERGDNELPKERRVASPCS